MSISSFEIRVCESCGLRYPLAEGNSFGARCPQCLGGTRVLIKHEIRRENNTPKKKTKKAEKTAVLLDNIRSAWNVGSILRTSDGFGFDRAYLCGITPTPDLESVRKTSLGAEESVRWSHHKDAVKLARRMKKLGWKIFALEENDRSQPIARVEYPTRAMLILGSEVTGVDPDLLDLADQIFHIPMRGKKRSFNVANAFSIAAYALGW